MKRHGLLIFLISGILAFVPIMGSEAPQQGSFSEIWAYLMPGEEKELSGKEPITDVCYFTGEISYKGELVIGSKFPKSAKIPRKTRVHLVIADIRNMDLIHFLVDPSLQLRNKFIKDIVKASEDYNGVQIDFESVHCDDRELFFSFLKDIKKAIGNKRLSVAIPARVEERKDAFCYKTLSSIVDRIFIMAYDEHWSGSQPGPVASSEWCEKVAHFAASMVPSNQLIMGIPFYGRSWQNKKNDRALRYMTTQDLISESAQNVRHFTGPNPGFEYEESVKVTVYYENTASLVNKAALYKSEGIQSIGFWRIGQGPKDFWNALAVEEKNNK
jgi:spore germination protein